MSIESSDSTYTLHRLLINTEWFEMPFWLIHGRLSFFSNCIPLYLFLLTIVAGFRRCQDTSVSWAIETSHTERLKERDAHAITR